MKERQDCSPLDLGKFRLLCPRGHEATIIDTSEDEKYAIGIELYCPICEAHVFIGAAEG